ncbi:PPM-type phosphatase domain-containing protein, partial [Trichostrongylus colubriformis]
SWKPSGSIPSRAGTTACVGLLRKGRLWTANCGDSTCVLGVRVGEGSSWYPAGIRATSPHSLNAQERARITRDGGQVAIDSRGDARVVFSWCNRHCWARQSRCSHRKSHHPCLNITRSLGDFWSFSSDTGRFAISCDPDIRSFSIADDNIFAFCLHSDGLALSPGHIENAPRIKSTNLASELIIQNRHYLKSRSYRDNVASIVVLIHQLPAN